MKLNHGKDLEKKDNPMAMAWELTNSLREKEKGRDHLQTTFFSILSITQASESISLEVTYTYTSIQETKG